MESYTSGTWTVRPGEEEAFVDDWRAFVETATGIEGAGTFRLTRDLKDPSRFLSFAPWASSEAIGAWAQSDEFMTRFERVTAHTTEFASRELELVTTVEAGAYAPA